MHKRTTLLLEPEIHKALLERCEKEQRTLKIVVNSLLKSALRLNPRKQSKPKEPDQPDLFNYRNGVVPHKTQSLWIESYKDKEWIQQEINKLDTWYSHNTHKNYKDFARFYSNNLARSWDKHCKTIKSNESFTPTDIEAILKEG